VVIDTIETDEGGQEIQTQRTTTLIYVSLLRQVQKARQDSCR
jgi:hypothetical protein